MANNEDETLRGTRENPEPLAELDSTQSSHLSGRPDKVSMGSGLPLSRKLNRLHAQQQSEFCRFNALNSEVAEFEVPNCFVMLSFLRRRVYEFAHNMPFSKEELQDIILAVGEATTNAMKHGGTNNPCSVRVKIEKHPDSLRVFIFDDGTSFGHEAWVPIQRGSLEEGGRGIGCMKAVMDEVLFHAYETGTCVEMVKYLSIPH